MSRLPLTALQVFEAVAAQQSFAGAARALHVTPAAVSQQVRALESQFGYPLFDRSASLTRLTAEGARLLPGVRRAFAELRRTLEEARRGADAPRLNITMLASFLQRWLLPRLPEFQHSHPDIDLRLSASTELVNFESSDFDAGIRYGVGRWPGLRATKLFDDWLLPVCHPELLRKHGPIRQAHDLAKFPLLHGDEFESWQDWVKLRFGRSETVPPGPKLDDSAAIIVAAERGQGLALARWSLVAASVNNGQLACAADTAVQYLRSCYLVAPHSKADRPVVRAFREWLCKAGAESALPPVALKPLRKRAGSAG
ncbi:MAG: LysR substrate-binding domain-containing protein [Stenotrophobium sp.]